MPVRMCVSVYVHVCVFMYMCVSVYVCMHFRACAFGHQCIYAYLYALLCFMFIYAGEKGIFGVHARKIWDQNTAENPEQVSPPGCHGRHFQF